MVISNLVLTRQIYSEETTGAHAHYREPVPLTTKFKKNGHGFQQTTIWFHVRKTTIEKLKKKLQKLKQWKERLSG